MSQKNTMISAIALVLALASTGATRAEVLWSAIGAAGSIDDGSVKSYDVRRASLWVGNQATLPATVVARYNISPNDMLSRSLGTLVADVFDNGADASVTIQLFEQPLDGGAMESALVTIQSDSLQDSATTFRRGSDCHQAIAFDFESNAYYVMVTLRRGSTAGFPGLQAIRLISADACQ